MGAAKAHQRAEAMVVARVPRNRCQSGGQNLAEAVLTIGGRPRSRGIPKGSRHVRESAYDAYSETSPKIQAKRNTVIALREKSRGVFHHSCLAKVFGDASE